MKKNNLKQLRFDILNLAKKHVIYNGWNDQITELIANEKKYKISKIIGLFPEGYKSILELYLYNADNEMVKKCNNINLIRMRTPERIKKIILLRLKINEKEKKLIKKTLFALMLPQHSKIATSSLYNTINQIWYLAGDNSTDFNFYTKRIILSGIYCSTLFYWINKQNGSIELTKIFLDNQLKKISKFSKLKKNLNIFSDLAMNIFSVAKNFSKTKQ